VHLTAVTKASEVASSPAKRSRQIEALRQAWRDAGHPPLVVGGDFNQPAVGENYLLMTRDFNDTLGLLGQTASTFGRKLFQVRIDYLLATPDWEPVAGGVIRGNASDHRPVWVDLKPAPPGATTRPATRPSTQPAVPDRSSQASTARLSAVTSG
jgi:endonuclease/exonuclease/phosphatase (EEP) superfamily protein YafD